MIFERAQGKTNVAFLVERKTRFAVLFRNNGFVPTKVREVL
jgi:IS30 family transposase